MHSGDLRNADRGSWRRSEGRNARLTERRNTRNDTDIGWRRRRERGDADEKKRILKQRSEELNHADDSTPTVSSLEVSHSCETERSRNFSVSARASRVQLADLRCERHWHPARHASTFSRLDGRSQSTSHPCRNTAPLFDKSEIAAWRLKTAPRSTGRKETQKNKSEIAAWRLKTAPEATLCGSSRAPRLGTAGLLFIVSSPNCG